MNPTLSTDRHHEGEPHDVAAWLTRFREPLLLTHVRPDGDAIGSLAALSMALAQHGMEPRTTLFGPLPRRYAMLSEAANWLDWEESREVLKQSCDCVIIADTCALAQLEPAASWLLSGGPTLIIDHHVSRDRIGTRDVDLCLFDESASACALQVAELLPALGVSVTAPLATALLVGIGTDTGWFRYSNTDARTLRMVADLAAAGADVSGIYSAIYQQEPAAKLRLIARMLDQIELHAGGQLAVLKLRPADFEAAGADRSMTEDLVNEAGRLAGVEATLLFTEEPGNPIRLNLRSRSRFDVASFARRFGGGGHERAAGARLNGAWEEVVPRVVAEVARLLGG